MYGERFKRRVNEMVGMKIEEQHVDLTAKVEAQKINLNTFRKVYEHLQRDVRITEGPPCSPAQLFPLAKYTTCRVEVGRSCAGTMSQNAPPWIQMSK